MIRATAPTRVDLAGGTLDIWPICQLLTRPACTVNLALGLRARVEARTRSDGRIRLESVDRGFAVEYAAHEPDHGRFPIASRLAEALAPGAGLSLVVESAVPPQSGLGGSSALAVAVGAALLRLAGRTLDAEPFLRVVQNVETRLLGLPTGYQDYVPALYGGVASLQATLDGVRRLPLPDAGPFLARTLLLADTRIEHESGMNNWEVVRAFLDGDRDVRAAMNRINEAAYAMERALLDRDLAAAARALDDEWTARRTLAPVVTNERIEALVGAARDAGALAAKVCGAGGGGCVAMLAEPGRHAAIARAVEEQGGAMLAVAVDPDGLRLEDR